MTERRWWGVDGEGIGRRPHRYVLLAASDSDGRSRYVENYKGLSSIECLLFLASLPETARLAGYYLGYDWTMILKDLPNKKVYMLLRPETRIVERGEGQSFSWIHWKGFQLHFLAGAMQIRFRGKTTTVWDLGKYYQAPFVDSIAAWGVNVDVDAIAEMKGKRSEFKASDALKIRKYCLSECRGLAELGEKLEHAHETIGLRPPVWHGPGSTASSALKRLGIKEKRGQDRIPPAALGPIDCAFFGGRFEHRLCGTVQQVWARDIASAYPYQIYKLPCMQHAVWWHTQKEAKIMGAAQACVRFRIRDVGNVPWGPLPIRLKNGTIVYPRSGGTGWVWLDEWLTAREHWDGLEFVEAYALKTPCDCHPFAQFLEWYEERYRVGKDSGAGRTLKLVINSGYGKLAQSIGRPQFASRALAGMITSGCRAQLLRGMVAHSSLDAVIGVATDGIFATEEAKLEAPPLYPSTLGSWETKYEGAMHFVRPGIYWSDNEAKPKLRARGMGRKKLLEQRQTVLDAIERGDMGRINLGTSTLFGGARACIYRTPKNVLKRSEHYGEWHEGPATVSLTPAPKRQADWSLYRLPDVESAPYSKTGTSGDGEVLARIADLFWGMK